MGDNMEVINTKESIVKSNPDFVDLGLSVKWANTNVEADAPANAGVYVAFGEIEPKKTYSERTYTCDGFKDVAQCEGAGRMPTKEEAWELKTKCVWETGKLGKTDGVYITGKNGNIIFLPFTGTMEKSKKTHTKEVYVWLTGGFVLNYNNTGAHIMSNSAYDGCAVRAVMGEE